MSRKAFPKQDAALASIEEFDYDLVEKTDSESQEESFYGPQNNPAKILVRQEHVRIYGNIMEEIRTLYDESVELDEDLIETIKSQKEKSLQEDEKETLFNVIAELSSLDRFEDAKIIISKIDAKSFTEIQQSQLLNYFANNRNVDLLQSLVEIGFNPGAIGENEKDALTTFAEQSTWKSDHEIGYSESSKEKYEKELAMANILLTQGNEGQKVRGFENQYITNLVLKAINTNDDEQKKPLILLNELASSFGRFGREEDGTARSLKKLFSNADRMQKIITICKLPEEETKSALAEVYGAKFTEIPSTSPKESSTTAKKSRSCLIL